MFNSLDENQICTNSFEDTMTLLTVEDAANILMVGKNRIYELLKQEGTAVLRQSFLMLVL